MYAIIYLQMTKKNLFHLKSIYTYRVMLARWLIFFLLDWPGGPIWTGPVDPVLKIHKKILHSKTGQRYKIRHFHNRISNGGYSSSTHISQINANIYISSHTITRHHALQLTLKAVMACLLHCLVHLHYRFLGLLEVYAEQPSPAFQFYRVQTANCGNS